ncbi:MAG TPA: Uma2 family endonuclease [Solirubrobacteraceae bacterium]|nr:Uma2 family endonuclease [Solirubrobacteraceae bacterium]
MVVHVDAVLPVHALTVADVDAMLEAGILAESSRIELLDGVLVEMSPQGPPHAYALRELTMLGAPIAAEAGLVLSIQGPLDVGSPVSRPEPDFAIVPHTPIDRHPTGALLVVEMGNTSLAMDLGPKARIYAEGGVPEYWVLDVKRREIVVHLTPRGSGYEHVRRHGADETLTASTVALTVAVAALV